MALGNHTQCTPLGFSKNIILEFAEFVCWHGILGLVAEVGLFHHFHDIGVDTRIMLSLNEPDALVSLRHHKRMAHKSAPSWSETGRMS
jgi:hypothetical protein